MKKLLFILVLIIGSLAVKAQTNPFPSIDSLERFINRYIRNSPVEAFQNLRMNTTLIGMLRFLQNSEAGSGVDTMFLSGCTLRLVTQGGDTMNVSLCGKLDSVTIETATDPDPDTLFEWRGSARTQVGFIPKGGGSGTSLYTNIVDYGAVGDGVTDNTNAINAAIVDATTNGKPIVFFPEGIWLVQSAYRDTAVAYKPTGIQLKSGVTLMGAGIGRTVIKLSAPPVSSTFSAVSAPVTFSTNTSFNHIIWGTNVSNVVLRDFSVHGNLANQVNYNANPYLTPQDSTHTDSVETDGIKFWFGSNNRIVNVRIDSVAGYGVANFGSTNLLIDRCVVTTSVNGGVYYTRAAYGSVLSNSLITNNHCDNVRVRSNHVTIGPGNEISRSKFNPNVLQLNFAGVYIECDSNTNLMPPSIMGVKVIGNYIHDNSAYGVDFFNRDTLIYTAQGPSVLISNNTISYNSNAGITMHGPMMQISDNQILENGANSEGVQDPVGIRECGIALTQYAVSSSITGNVFRDTRGFQDYALGGAAPDVPNNLYATGNSMFGGTQFLQSPSSTYSVSIFANNFLQNAAGSIQSDFKRRSISGNLLINPTTNGVDFFNGTGSGYAAFRYGANFEAGIVGQNSSGTNHIGFGASDRAHWNSSGAGTNTGREFWIYDFVSAAYRAGMNLNGEWFIGPAISSYSFRVKQPGADLTGTNQAEINGTGIGSTAAQVQSALRVQMLAGYTGAGTNIGIYSTNAAVQTGNIIGGAGVFRGALAYYGGATGAGTSGANTGGLFFSTSALKNVGIIGDATVSQLNNSSARSIGVIGYALRNNASAFHIGGFFGLMGTEPTWENGALIADNGSTGDPLIKLRTNGTNSFIVRSGGNTTINTTATTSDIVSRLLYVNGSIGANKDSITTIAAPTTHFIQLLDTAAAPELGKFNKLAATYYASQSALNDTAAAIRADFPAGGGLTSINSETGPAFTIAGGNGLTVNTTTNTATAVLGGTLSGATSIAGGSNSLNLGTGGSKITTLAMNVSTSANIVSDARIQLLGNMTYQAVFFNSDATHSVAANTQILHLNTSSLTTDRAITLPTAVTHGQTLTITVDFSSSGNHYTLASAITDIKTGSTFTQLEFGTTYDLMVNNSIAWTVIRKY